MSPSVRACISKVWRSGFHLPRSGNTGPVLHGHASEPLDIVIIGAARPDRHYRLISRKMAISDVIGPLTLVRLRLKGLHMYGLHSVHIMQMNIMLWALDHISMYHCIYNTNISIYTNLLLLLLPEP